MTRIKEAPSLNLFRFKEEPRPAKVGLLIPTDPFLAEEAVKIELQFNREGIGKYEQTPHTVGAKYWKSEYEKSYKIKGYTQESAWAFYAGAHFSLVDAINAEFKRHPTGEFMEHEEIVAMVKNKLFSKTIRADSIYEYGLISLRINVSDERKAQELEALGFALLEKAEEMDPRDPKKKLALWKEHERIAEKRRKLKAKGVKEAESVKEKNRLDPRLIYRLKNPELGKEFTTSYYINKTGHWADVLEKVPEGRKIDYLRFRLEHTRIVAAAKKEMDNRRGPDKRRTRFTPSFFIDMFAYKKLDAFNAYYWGLVALYTPTRSKLVRSQLELLGFALLEKSHEFSVQERKTEGKNPSAYYPWAINEEYLLRMVKPGVQSKRKVRARDFADMYGRELAKERGGLLKNPGRTSLLPIPEPTSPLDEIPR